MPRRQTATEKWSDAWFMRLSPEQKLAWLYLLDSCDCCGIWDRNDTLANVQIGTQIDWDEALNAFGERRVCALPNGKWFIARFVEFQYGTNLSAESNIHRSVFARLVDHGLLDNPSLGPPLVKACSSLIGTKEKEKTKSAGKGSGETQRPALETVLLLAEKAGLPRLEAEKFFNFYESKGWMVGRNPMRSISHALAGWKLTWQERSAKGNGVSARRGQPI